MSATAFVAKREAMTNRKSLAQPCEVPFISPGPLTDPACGPSKRRQTVDADAVLLLLILPKTLVTLLICPCGHLRSITLIGVERLTVSARAAHPIYRDAANRSCP